MELHDVATISVLVFVYGLISARLDRSDITPPMFFTGAGLILGTAGLSRLDSLPSGGFVSLVAEATLIFVLFTDASRIDLGRLRRHLGLPARLLGIGMPLQILFGLLLAKLLLPELSWWEAGLLSSVLAPTDAALGQAVVSNRDLPPRIRQTLNVESGLNDGIALPVVTIFIATCLTLELDRPAGFWFEFVARQLLIGAGVGLAVGFFGARLIDWASSRRWLDRSFRQITSLAVAVAAYALAHLGEGNGFIAAFVAGAAFGAATPKHCENLVEFAEEEGQLLALLTFLLFGAVLLGGPLERLSLPVVIYALLSLTVIRMVPVALALIGAGLRGPTVAFLGWFGPRGLASILFALLIVEVSQVGNSALIVDVVLFTVLLSVVLHGVTARPFSRRLARYLAGKEEAAEHQPMPEMARVAPAEAVASLETDNYHN